MAGAAAEVTRTTQAIATALNPVTGPLHALVTGHRETSLELTRKLSQLANVHGTQLRVMLAVIDITRHEWPYPWMDPAWYNPGLPGTRSP